VTGIVIRIALLLAALFPLAAQEQKLRALLQPSTGMVRLPAGTFTLSEPLEIEAPHDLAVLGSSRGTILRASPRFRGAALLVVRGGQRVAIRNLTFDGNRAALERRQGLPPYDQPFARFTAHNGVLAADVTELQLEDLRLREIAGFAILVNGGRKIRIHRAEIVNSGSRNEAGRNNTTGGILIEEGTADFDIQFCRLRNIRGNGIWTHSLYTSPRSRDGLILSNHFATIGRDAIQAGHAINIRVERNTGTRIGFPAEEVDIENQGIPVAIDTAGNVEASTYAFNEFTEINGKCIDLDGFHHGTVRRNRCVNTKPDYPFGHYGIVFNNTNPDMRSEAVVVAENELEGMRYGGIFVIGTGHTIEKNRMRNLNTAQCPEAHGRKIKTSVTHCYVTLEEPEMLAAGIYLAKGAERPDPARTNIVRDNLIVGFKMKQRCVVAAPGLAIEANTIERNVCLDPSPAAH
jgi:hypothetical protein